MKKAVLLISLLIAFSSVNSQSASSDDFQKVFSDAQNDFAKYKGKAHEEGGGFGGGTHTWYEYEINLWNADIVKLLKGTWDLSYTLRYKYTKETEPQKGLELLEKLLESIKSRYPEGCVIKEEKNLNTGDPIYTIASSKDVNVFEDEGEATYPVIHLYLDYNDVTLEISGCVQE